MFSPHRDIAQWYDELSKGWGHNYSSGDRHFLRRLRNVHLMVQPIVPEAEILDIGCATGEITSSLHERFGCRTVGLDISSNMIEYCKTNFASEGLKFEVGDILNLPFNNGQFDLIVSMSVIEWIQDYRRGISEVSRVLNSGGQWIVSIPNWRSPVRKLEYVKSLFTLESYLRLQKNRISVSMFKSIALQYGMKINRTIYHVLPWYYKNMEGHLGQYLGAMCILSLRKVE